MGSCRICLGNNSMIKVDPIQRRQFGIIALGLATIFLSVSAAAGVGNAIRRDSVANEVISANKECENRLKLLGVMNVSMGEDKIVANWNSLEGGYTLIGNASAAARSEEHTSELQSLMRISYAVFCLKKKKK